jgi:hypothetical protein
LPLNSMCVSSSFTNVLFIEGEGISIALRSMDNEFLV